MSKLEKKESTPEEIAAQEDEKLAAEKAAEEEKLAAEKEAEKAAEKAAEEAAKNDKILEHQRRDNCLK